MLNHPAEIDENSLDEYTSYERRLHKRVRRSFAIFYDRAGAVSMLTTENISAGGLYLYTRAELAVGDFVTLGLPNGTDETIIVRAQVIHRDPGRGVGVRFVSLSEKARALLDAHLEEF